MTTGIRIATLLLGGFAFGMTLLVTVLYLAVWRRLRTNGIVPVYHVPVIGLSHMIMIGAFMGVIASRVARHEPFSYWLSPVICVAFALSIGVLVQLLRSERVRGLNKKVNEHGRK